MRVTFSLFRLALRGYWVALLPRALRSHSWLLQSLGLRVSHSHSQSLCSLELRTSGKVQPYLLHDTPRVPRSVHAKFHHDRIKTMGAKGIHTQFSGLRDKISGQRTDLLLTVSVLGQKMSVPKRHSVGKIVEMVSYYYISDRSFQSF